ncbi:response regulator receiver protein [Stutzerimonas stutzeri]|nr:response regulator receiver protein [Stutzerimonas stutzeri]|tara:strand:- start:12351 stop:12917 length:567 start_codon:yes stop_codon:yes gene_type:complete
MRILVVEDEFLIAEQLSRDISNLGDTVIGPFSDIGDAMCSLTSADAEAAILDVRLGAQTSFCIADQLSLQEVPFVFLTGYTARDVPDRFSQTVIHAKPSPTRSLLLQLHAQRLRFGDADGVQEVMVDMLSYVRLVASDAAAAERLVERVMLQAIRAIEGGDAVTGTLRGLMIALMDHEIARNLPRHFH